MRKAAYFLLLFSTLPLRAQEEEELPGYELRNDHVLIATPDHWRAWAAPTGARLIRPDGTVEPRLLRRRVNAVLRAETDSVLARVTSAGSNFDEAPFAIDGDSLSFWEPRAEDPVSAWHLEVDLGRTVIGESIRLRFAKDGDPFLKFRVLVSDGLPSFGRGKELQFSRVALVNNLDRLRDFTFALEPQKKVAEGVEGAIVQVVRIDVLDSDGPRAHPVSAAEYEALPADLRGAIDYFLRTASGREIAVSQQTWAALPADEQGPLRHYRRERPRLAEVEVVALGENIVAITQAEQEREALKLGKFDFLLFRTFTDGLFGTVRDMLFYDPVQDENQVEIDLGAKYWLDRIALLSPDRPPFAYQVRISEGALDPGGSLVWTTFDERQNLERLLHVEERFPLQEVRHIEVRQLRFSGSNFEKGRLSEIQAFGEGYVSEISMTSPFVRLGRPRLFTHLTWEGEAPPNTRVEIQTRTGEQVTLLPHYFTKNGREISEDLWRRLPEPDRPPPQLEEITGPDWSNWSEPYAFSGDAFDSPTPRPLARVRVRLVSREPLQRPWIRALRLHFVPPLVDQALGEIHPASGVEPGTDEQFTLFLRPSFGSDNPGFDRVALRSSSAAGLELLEVRAGGEEEMRQGGGERLWPGSLELQSGAEGEIVLSFPEPVARGNRLYAFRFRTRVFLQSTLFSARLQHSAQPLLQQEASAGDATALSPTQSMVVVSRLQQTSLLEALQVDPPVFTPNGDGINDQVEVRLAIFHLETPKTLGVEIFDLSGRRVRDLSVHRAHPSGEHRLLWDGRDRGGDLLPPGLYLVRVHFSTDSRASDTRAARLVHLVY